MSWSWDPRIDPDLLDRVLAELTEQGIVPGDFDVTRFLATAL